MTDHSDLIAELRACATARTGENPYRMLSQAVDALSSQSLSLSEARADLTASRKLVERREAERDREKERADGNWDAYRDMIHERDAAREEIERLRDFGGDAVDLAGRILENLGIGQDASREPSADRRRDRIAAMIQRSLDAANAHAPALENGPAGLADAHTKSPDPSLSSLRKGAEVVGWMFTHEDGTRSFVSDPGTKRIWEETMKRELVPVAALISGSREEQS